MLLWIILGGVLIGVVWALFFIFGWGTGFPATVTILIILAVAAIWGIKKLLARRAAKKLENALQEQAAKQAENARPERRAEIQELQKKLQEGITAIKTSKSSQGGKIGAAALYALPWYMIIGPPGAGKTTALKHSGLVFPGGNAGAVRGVGGTRNCDWWFTNDAIILDTAGRYTTESDDRDEWIAFLQFLLKYRQKRPINGIIIAISITELLDASEAQIETTGKKLRARIDEVITQLHMVVPVYMLFTKIDLVSGFVEFFGDMKKSDRAQVWGATVPLSVPKDDPGKLFDVEFDTMIKQLHGRALRRCAQERSREAREKLFRFPIELAALKKNLSDLVGVTFAPNTFQGTPMLRGFYFTSGTQEGKPMDRVLERMSAAMGIRPQAAAQGQPQPQQNPNIESKSYFLYNLFTNIIFKDGYLGILSAVEERRQMMLKLAIAGATIGLAALLCVPALTSYSNNKAFLDRSLEKTKQSAQLKWEDNAPLSSKPPLLKPTMTLLKEHDKIREEGVPWGMGWWMFKADKVYQPTLKLYAKLMYDGFVKPCMTDLEAQLAISDVTKKYLKTRTLLKQYLMLREIAKLDVDWATGRYTRLWVEHNRARNDADDPTLKSAMKPFIQYYLELLKDGRIEPIKLNDPLIEKLRGALMAVDVNDRYYNMIVLSLDEELIDEAGDDDYSNKVFPPVQLPRLFPHLANAQKFFQSRKFLAGNGYMEVGGPYTDKGHYAVTQQIKGAEQLMRSEAWVVPQTPDETAGKVPEYIRNVKNRYEQLYVQSWTDFVQDIKITTPAECPLPDGRSPPPPPGTCGIEQALELFTLLKDAEAGPHRTLLERLTDHTQWRNANPLENAAVAREANRRVNQKINMYTQGIIINVNLKDLADKMEKIPTTFRSTCKFNEQKRQLPNGAGDTKPISGNTDLFNYAEIMRKLVNRVEDAKTNYARQAAADPKVAAVPLQLVELNDDFYAAREASKNLLREYDTLAQQLLLPLLLMPLNIGVRPEVSDIKDPKNLNKDFQWQNGKPPPGGTPPPAPPGPAPRPPQPHR